MHAQKLVEKAQDAADRRAWDHAIEFYLQALQLDPDHGEGREGLRKAELAKYEAYYPSGLTRFFGTFGAKFNRWFAGLTKNHEKKMIACEKILAKDPKNIETSMMLADAAVAAGHRNAAAAAYRGILLSDENHLEALKGLGRMLAQLGKPREALQSYERAVEISPRDQEATRMRKNLAAEVSITDTGIDRSQHSRDVLRDREETDQLEKGGRIVRGADELEESARQIEEQLADEPENPQLWQELGSRYSALKQFDKAIAAFEKAAGLLPENFSLGERLGDLKISRFDRRIRAAQNDTEKQRLVRERRDFVVEEYRSRVQNHPTDLVLHFQLGKALYDAGDLDGAIGEFQQANRDPRRKIESLTMLGNCFLRKGMFDLAENQLQKALEASPGMSDRVKDIRFSLGMLKEKQGDLPAAVAEYKKIYEVDISYKSIAEKIENLKKKIAES